MLENRLNFCLIKFGKVTNANDKLLDNLSNGSLPELVNRLAEGFVKPLVAALGPDVETAISKFLRHV